MRGAARQAQRPQPQRLGGFRHDLLHTQGDGDGLLQMLPRQSGIEPPPRRDLLQRAFDLIARPQERFALRAPHLHRHIYPPGDDVHHVRADAQETDGADALLHDVRRADDALHRQRQLRRPRERVPPVRHRRRPCMIRNAGERDDGPARRGDDGHNADLHPRAFQHRPLLDVQFEVTVDIAGLPPSLVQPRRVAPEPGDSVRQRAAVGRGGLGDHRSGYVAGHDAAAERAQIDDRRLLADEVHDLQRMRERVAGLPQAAHSFQRAEHAHDTVEPPAGLDGVGVGADHEHGACALADAPDEVAGGVDADVESGVAEALRQPYPPRLVLRGECAARVG